MTTYYQKNKEAISIYKKKFYKKKMEKYQAFSNIKIYKATKNQSRKLIKYAIDSGYFQICISDIDVNLSVEDFINHFKFKSFSIIEVVMTCNDDLNKDITINLKDTNNIDDIYNLFKKPKISENHEKYIKIHISNLNIEPIL